MPNQSTPPVGDHQQAEKYLTQLLSTLESHLYPLTRSDLSTNPGNFQDHYRIDLGQYHAEVSHSKHPQSGNDIYSLIFTSLEKIRLGQTDQAVLSYIPLTQDLFSRFKNAAESYFAAKKRLEEQKRFREAMQPIDDILKSSPPRSEDSPRRDYRDTRYHQPRNNPPETSRPPEPKPEPLASIPTSRDEPSSQFFHEFNLNNPQPVFTPPEDSPKD